MVDSGVESRYKNHTESKTNKKIFNGQLLHDNEPTGIGGWLILVILGYIRSFVSYASAISEIYNHYIDGSIALIADRESGYYNPQLLSVINFEMITNISILLFLVVIAVCLFRKKKIFPKLAIALIIISGTVTVFDYIFAYLIGLEVTDFEIAEIVGMLIGSIPWIFYFIKSKRVKNTFVN